MYTLDEINTILSDLDACGGAGKSCAACSRSDHGRVNMKACFGLESDAAAAIRWLLSEFNRYSGVQMQIGGNAKDCPGSNCDFCSRLTGARRLKRVEEVDADA